MPYDSPEASFLASNILAKLPWGHPNGDTTYRCSGLQLAIFDQFLAVSQKWHKTAGTYNDLEVT